MATPRKANPSKGGRPREYKPDYADQAKKLCILGATDMEIADFFRVSTRTIDRWKNDFPEFCRSLQVGKEHADERVARSLYNRAVGYSFETEEIFQHQGTVVRAKSTKHVPPDTTAQIFWLKNRRRDEWRDRSQQEISGPDGGPIEHKVESPLDVLDARLSALASRIGAPGAGPKPDDGAS